MTEQAIVDARAIFLEAVRSVQAERVLRDVELACLAGRELECFRHVYLLAAGKAAMAMAGVIERQLAGCLTGGLAVVPYGYMATFPVGQQAPELVEVMEAGHPVPDKASMMAAERALAIAERCGRDDLLLVLLSGGASALWLAPVHPVTLADLARVNELLLRSGADIHEINTVRKHLSRIKGGKLSALAWPANTVTLVISDVTGDDMSVIGSGPTTADPTTRADAMAVVTNRHLELPVAVRRYLEKGVSGEVPDTAGMDDSRLLRANARIIGSNRLAVHRAARAACSLGYEVVRADLDVRGEARLVGVERAREALGLAPGQCIVWGGETTVTVCGSGKGGRNQEVALAAACAWDGTQGNMILLSAGTDGIDGPTGAAGAWATPSTAALARAQGLNPEVALRQNDAYTLFAGVNQLLITGPTHTNVMDLGLTIHAKK